MKIFTTGLDANGRSTHGAIEFVMKKVSETESISAKQPGRIWYYRQVTELSSLPQTSKDFDAPGGAFEQHAGGLPHMPILLTGHWDTLLQDGTVCRFAPGDVHLTRPGAIHQTNLHSLVPITEINIYLTASATDTGAFGEAAKFAPLVDVKAAEEY